MKPVKISLGFLRIIRRFRIVGQETNNNKGKEVGKAVDRRNNSEDAGWRSTHNNRTMYGVVGDDDLFPKYGPGGTNSLGGPMYDPVTKRYYALDFKNGVYGLYIKRYFIDYSSENKKENITASVFLLYEWHPGSLNHYRAMSNPIAQAYRQGQQDFVANPFGGAMMMLVTGGGLGGGGAIAGKALSGLKALSPVITSGGSALSSIAMRNIMTSGMKNIVINTSTQLIFNGGNFDKLDIADIAISGVSGKSFAFSTIFGTLINMDAGGNFSTINNSYKGMVDLTTGIFFGALTNQVGVTLGTKNVGEGIKNSVDFTLSLYQGLSNYTLSGGDH